MKYFLLLSLFIIGLKNMYACNINQVLIEEEADKVFPLYHNYYLSGYAEGKYTQEEFKENTLKATQNGNYFMFFSTSKNEGKIQGFLDASIMPSTYAKGMLMRIDSFAVDIEVNGKSSLNLTKDELINMTAEQLQDLNDKENTISEGLYNKLKEIIRREKVVKVIFDSGEEYSQEHRLMKNFLPEVNNKIFRKYLENK